VCTGAAFAHFHLNMTPQCRRVLLLQHPETARLVHLAASLGSANTAAAARPGTQARLLGGAPPQLKFGSPLGRSPISSSQRRRQVGLCLWGCVRRAVHAGIKVCAACRWLGDCWLGRMRQAPCRACRKWHRL